MERLVLYQMIVKYEGEKQIGQRRELAVLDIATGTSVPVAGLSLNGDTDTYCWSPDGKKIAYTWREIPEVKPGALVQKRIW